MRQYLDVKARYPDAIVFFRLGDFYEMFYEDATYVARVLNLTLTTRDKGKEDAVPMCGVPHHAVRSYLAKLNELGHRVALCEQLEDPKVARGIVRRDVVRVVTPGVVLDEESLDPRAPSYVAAVAGDGRRGSPATAATKLGARGSSDSSSRFTPGVTTRTTSRLTIPRATRGSSSCSHSATR